LKRSFFCPHQVLDNKGLVNCTYFDGSVGLCTYDNCPNKLWALRLILHHATYGGLRIKLRGLMAEMPLLKVIAHE
jgi:hypothetical protein